MQNVDLLHKPKWGQVGLERHLFVRKKSVAKLITNFDKRLPRCKWLSIIEGDYYGSFTWNAVDFETLEGAKYCIKQWWLHSCRGQGFTILSGE